MKTNNPPRGFTLIEALLGLIIISTSIIAVFSLLTGARANAAIEREISNIKSIADVITQLPSTRANGYNGLTTANFIATYGASIPAGMLSGAGSTLKSQFNTPILIRPATVVAPGDAVDLVYRNLSAEQCQKLTRTVFLASYDVLINEISDPTSGAITTPGNSVQNTEGEQAGRLRNEAMILGPSACGAPAFESNTGVVAFRFYTNNAVAATGPIGGGILCSPCVARQESDFTACPIGQNGQINRTRNITCSGAGTCQTEAAGAWVNGLNTCAPTPTAPGAPSTPPPPGYACTPSTETRSTTCPAGEIGTITEQRVSSCATATANPVWTAWAQTSNSCAAPVTAPGAPCTPSTIINPNPPACPAGQSGAIVQHKTSTCASPSSAAVWPATWVTVSDSCGIVPSTCVPGTRTETVACAAGFTGSIVQSITNTCPSPSAAPVDGAPVEISNTCTPGSPPAPPMTYFFDCMQDPGSDWAFLNKDFSGAAKLNHTYNEKKGFDRWTCGCKDGSTKTQVFKNSSAPLGPFDYTGLSPDLATYLSDVLMPGTDYQVALYKCAGSDAAPYNAPQHSYTLIAATTRTWSRAGASCVATLPAGTKVYNGTAVFIDTTPPGVGVAYFATYTAEPATTPNFGVRSSSPGEFNPLGISYCTP